MARPGLSTARRMGHDRGMTVRWGVAVQDVLGEIADQLGMRVIEGPAELP